MNIVIENKGLAIHFNSADNGFDIAEIVCKNPTETSFLNLAEGLPAFWKATFWEASDKREQPPVAITLDNHSPCRSKRYESTPDGGAKFFWDGLSLSPDDHAVTVCATVRFAPDGTSRWSLEIRNHSPRYALAETTYPIFRHVAASGEADALIPRTDLGASLFKKTVWGAKDRYFGCLGYHPMMTAFFKGTAGLYVAAHDSQARIKTLCVSKEHDISFITAIENAGLPGKAAEGPRYEVTVAALNGDWWQAADLYRQWALTTPWTAKGRILDRDDYPQHFADIPLWLNTHAYPEEVNETMDKARAVFPNSRVGIHWHLWQHSGHDVNYPEYFPEQPHTSDTLKHCQSIDCEAMPYTNGRLWSVNLQSFPLVKHLALTKADGQPYIEQYGTLTPPMSPMCPYTHQWDEVLNTFSKHVLDLGASSIFLDQIGACPGKACYHPDHGHPIGGGSWYFEGYQALLAKTHAMYAEKGAFITTEGSGEQWMNNIDGYLQVTQRQTTDVPFFHAVYGGYTTYFCSPENQDDDIISFRAAQTREILWGQALGWYHPLILEQQDKCSLLRSLAEFRQDNLDYFAYGTLLGEVKVLNDIAEVPIKWLGRKAFFLWKIKDAPLSPTIESTMPAVFGYVWKNGRTGTIRAFIANVGNTSQQAHIAFANHDCTLELAPGDITFIDA